MKPIEAGCKAIIYNYSPLMDGTEVIPIKFIGDAGTAHHRETRGEDRWLLNISFYAILAGGYQTNESLNTMRECYLMRIDGFKDQDQVSDGKELINVD